MASTNICAPVSPPSVRDSPRNCFNCISMDDENSKSTQKQHMPTSFCPTKGNVNEFRVKINISDKLFLFIIFMKRRDSNNQLNGAPDNFCCIAKGLVDNFIWMTAGVLIFSFDAEVVFDSLEHASD